MDGLFRCKPEYKVPGKAIGVPFDRLVQCLGRYAIYCCKIAIQNHPLAANRTNDLFNPQRHC